MPSVRGYLEKRLQDGWSGCENIRFFYGQDKPKDSWSDPGVFIAWGGLELGLEIIFHDK